LIADCHPCGGRRKRVFPLAANSPKPMFKLLGKPLIHHVIDTLKEAGLKDYVIVVGSQGRTDQRLPERWQQH
jgi:NDP-sugar pyrophosphorylase family protein